MTGKELEDPGMVLNIDLLLITGARHPFKIDAKYLRKRQVDVPDFNPYAMSVYTLKELIWREWRSGMSPVGIFFFFSCNGEHATTPCSFSRLFWGAM